MILFSFLFGVVGEIGLETQEEGRSRSRYRDSSGGRSWLDGGEWIDLGGSARRDEVSSYFQDARWEVLWDRG